LLAGNTKAVRFRESRFESSRVTAEEEIRLLSAVLFSDLVSEKPDNILAEHVRQR